MPISFAFSQRKATQAAAFLLHLHAGASMRRLRLIKLLYLAERESLREFGHPIVGDTYYSMPHGPVMSNVLNLAVENDDWINGDFWKRYIRKVGENSVGLVQEPKYTRLTPADIRILTKVHREQRARTRWEIRDMTHLFTEWHDPHGSSTPIPVEEILRAVNKTERAVERIAQASAERECFDRFFKSKA